MARFQPVVPNAQLGMTNIVGSQQPVPNIANQVNSQLAANQARAMNQQTMQQQQTQFSQEQRDRLMQKAAMTFGDAASRGASLSVRKGMLRNFALNSDVPEPVKKQMISMLDDPEAYRAVEAQLNTMYRNMPSELQRQKSLAKSTAKGSSVDLGTSKSFKKKNPETGEIVTAFVDKDSGRHIGPGGVDVSDWNDVSTQEAMKAAQKEHEIESKNDWYDDTLTKALEQRQTANRVLANVDQMSTLREQAATGSWTGVEDFVSSLLQGFGYENNEQGVRQAMQSVGFDFAKADFEVMKGAISNREFNRLQEVAPNLRMTPRGLTIALNMEQQYNQWLKDRSNFISETLDPSIMSRKEMVSALNEWEESNPAFNRDQLLEAIQIASKNPNYRMASWRSLVDKVTNARTAGGPGAPGNNVPEDLRMVPMEDLRNRLNQ